MARPIRLVLTAAAVLCAAGARAESPYIFGGHFWKEGCNLDAMSGRPGWVTDSRPVNYYNFGWDSEFKRIVDEGHTLILRLNDAGDWSGVPTSTADHERFAARCAHFAERLGEHCHIYLIGNEMSLGSVSAADYAAAWMKVRQAIHYVQPEAIVCPGAGASGGYLLSVAQAIGDYADGYTAHELGTQFVQEVDSWSVPGAKTKPIYVTEFGGAPPNIETLARNKFSEFNTWNQTHPHQIEAACWYVYFGYGNEWSSLLMQTMQSDDFEDAAANPYTNSYSRPYLSIGAVTASPTSETSATVSWTTDAAATSSVEYWQKGARTQTITPWTTYAQTPKTSHSIQLSGLVPGAEYEFQIRSYTGYRPWTRSPVRSFIQAGPGTGTIAGPVTTRAGTPLQNATVTRTPGGISVQTDASGAYLMRGVPAGTYKLTFSSAGTNSTVRSGVAVTAGQTVTVDAALVPRVNYLANPGFETGSVASWTGYGVSPGIQQAPWFADILPHSGTYYAGNAVNFGTNTGGVYQRVAVPTGKTLTARAWSNTYRGEHPYTETRARVGLDPDGGINPAAASVKWSGWDIAYDEWAESWDEMVSPSGVSATGFATIFLDYAKLEEVGWHINCFDDAAVSSDALQTQAVSNIAEARDMEDGVPVTVSGIATTNRTAGEWNDRFWIEDAGRASGIMVLTGALAPAVNEGDMVTLTGVLTTVNAERAISATAIGPVVSSQQLKPLFAVNWLIGGMDFAFEAGPPAKGQQGIPGAIGINNVGLLMRAAGSVVSTGAGFFVVSDGSPGGLKVSSAKLSAPPSEGAFVLVTGLVRVEQGEGGLVAVLAPRRNSDVVTAYEP